MGGAYGKEHYAKDAAARGLRYSRETFPATAEEREGIEREAKANGTWLKAPNGNPSELTPEQWVTVRTRAFKEWFGDWENDNSFPIQRQVGHGVGLGVKGVSLSALPLRFSTRVVSAVDITEDASIFDVFDDAANASEQAVLGDLREHISHELSAKQMSDGEGRAVRQIPRASPRSPHWGRTCS